MRVNIIGRGPIPGVSVVPPVRGIDLTEKQIRRILNYTQFRVYETMSGLLITQNNVSKFFATKKVEPKTTKVVVKTPAVVNETETVDIEPVTETTSVEIEETPLSEIEEEIVTEEKVEEPVLVGVDVATATEDVDVEDVVTADTVTEESVSDDKDTAVEENVNPQTQQNNYNGKRKKNRH